MTRNVIVNRLKTVLMALTLFTVASLSIVADDADKAGTLPFRCSNFCGLGHGGMKGTLVVEE
jgi:hypothetical protein